MKEASIETVRFSCTNGEAKIVKSRLALVTREQGDALHLFPGVTGNESFYTKDILEGIKSYRYSGIWWCAGTPGAWDGLYTSGLQLEKGLKELGLI